MNKIKTSRTLLSVALLGAFAIAPLMAPTAQADPPPQAPAYGRRAKDKKIKSKKNDKRYDRRDRYDRDDRRDDDRRDRDDRRDDYDRDRYDRDRDYRDRYDRDTRNRRNNTTLTGIVTDVRGNGFDVRANGRIYNVYLSSALPRGLSRGDEVRVYGRPYGVNDIRNASARITRQSSDRYDRDDRDRDDRYDRDRNDYRTYTGVVVSVKNSREFRVRANGREYDVYASNSTSGLDRGDEVRVYGRLYGTNDLRNASVRITRNR